MHQGLPDLCPISVCLASLAPSCWQDENSPLTFLVIDVQHGILFLSMVQMHSDLFPPVVPGVVEEVGGGKDLSVCLLGGEKQLVLPPLQPMESRACNITKKNVFFTVNGNII